MVGGSNGWNGEGVLHGLGERCGKTGPMARLPRLLLALPLLLPACGDDAPEVCRDSPLTDNDDRMWTPCLCEDERTGDDTRPDWHDGCLDAGNTTCVGSGTESICTRSCVPRLADCPPAFGRATVCYPNYPELGTCEIPCGKAADGAMCPEGMECEVDRYCIFQMAADP